MALASCFFPLPPPSRGACSRAHSAAAGTATSPPSSGTLEAILSSRIIACLRAQDADTAMEAACAALSGGISVLEIVMSTPGVLEVVKELLNHYPSSVIGVGTVLNAEDARKAVNAGAGFLMSPGTIMEILVDHHNSNVLYIPGAMTPTEVLFAHNTGARIVKIYPVSILGGERYISAIKKPFPHIPMVASQGITTETIGRYIGCGASAVVLSDAIFEKEAMARRDFKEICRLARLATLQVGQSAKI
ncbi:KHG/KDPG aldolase-like isoform X4 [Zingiber officinale]|uniref:KHG/KDPG aldolase-like isoform X4 n=1 Tax=Zingiber officinale TaxID=94328 RepID=UPI001C4CF887|nr:KHG/KDPG aldolase-like isoform X4 [Zingiber officinale]